MTNQKKISNIKVSFMGVTKGKVWIIFTEKGKKNSSVTIKFSKKDSQGIRNFFMKSDEFENRDRGSLDGSF